MRPASGLVIPQQFVQLHLVAHRQALGHDPVGEFAGRDLGVARREQHVAGIGEAVLGDDVARPVEIGAIADHELDLVMRGQQRQVLPAIARRFQRTGRLDIEHPRNAGINVRDVDRAGGFQ